MRASMLAAVAAPTRGPLSAPRLKQPRQAVSQFALSKHPGWPGFVESYLPEYRFTMSTRVCRYSIVLSLWLSTTVTSQQISHNQYQRYQAEGAGPLSGCCGALERQGVLNLALRHQYTSVHKLLPESQTLSTTHIADVKGSQRVV